MQKTKIVFNPFDYRSVEKAYNDLVLYEEKVKRKLDFFMKRLADYGVEIAQQKIVNYDAVFVGEMLSSLHVEARKDGIYAIVSDCEHTAFVEFGTGQLGSVVPYTKGLFESKGTWQYNIGKTIQKAEEDLIWGDRVIPKDTYFWFYFNDKTGRWELTQGMPSRPFMSETALKLSEMSTIQKIAKEVFR